MGKYFGDPKDAVANVTGASGMAGKAHAGVLHSTNKTISKGDDPVSSMTKSGGTAKGKFKNFSKLAIGSALRSYK